MKYLGRVLGPKEFLVVKVLTLLIVVSLGFLSFNFYRDHLKTVPVFGGQYSEGLVGGPQHINPLYASVNDIDADISSLVYSSLFKIGSEGEPEKDLVEDYSISEDGKTYTFKLKEGVKWHQGGELTVDDVFFTFQAIKDSAYNSPLKPSFAGIEAKIEDDRTIVFSLAEKYAPFLNLLTFGILPTQVWGQVPPQSAALADFNLKPVGSGPYKFSSLSKDKAGNVKVYKLEANQEYYGGRPLIKEFVFKFFGDFTEAVNALNNGEVDGLSYLPKAEKSSLIAKSSLNLNKLAMPKVRAVFFNADKNSLLKDIKVRQALSYATPRERIIAEVLGGEAQPAYGPIATENFAYNQNLERYNFDLGRAAALLVDAGWKKEVVGEEEIAALTAKMEGATSSTALSEDEKAKLALGPGEWLYKEELKNKNDKKSKEMKKVYFRLSLTVLDDEESASTGRFIMQSWEQLGVKVDLDLVGAASVQSMVIKPRTYEALLFSQLLGSDPDVYFFWHSSQSGEGGFNLSNYKNEEVDKLLEDGRVAADKEERIGKYKKFQELVNQEAAAIFLFSPYYIYPQGKKVKNSSIKTISEPADRFSDVTDWYIKTGRHFTW
jgi:peptide/nickel transport system substrate-binding protein